MKTTLQSLIITLTIMTAGFTLAFPVPVSNMSVLIYYLYFAAGLLLVALPLSLIAGFMKLCTSARLALYVAVGFAITTAFLGPDFMIPLFSTIACFWLVESVMIRFSYKELIIKRVANIFMYANVALILFVFFFVEL
ncbi:hypothetical protein [Jeotgalibacillus salarius]|uniref:Uncharacterized protein n=1 Tax=Jeotgalibacillus salarius TaxID=546023 RepID=A0A4Y8LHW6_9BACL|nr:hypothetical protein [Jeotgalibacillus salarius]TFE02402.1 hypothetical protein E2626_07440 [Jeotgalibacillus salarius]